MIDLLLAREDIDVNARNVHGETVLWYAAYAGRICALAKLLRRRNLDNDVPDAFLGMTPLALAVAHGHLSVTKALLDTGRVDINARDNRGLVSLYLSWTALLMVCYIGLLVDISTHLRRRVFWLRPGLPRHVNMRSCLV